MDVQIACRCPGQHGQDTVTFYDRLDFRRATVIAKALMFVDAKEGVARSAEVLAILSEFYILYGIKSWTLVGSDRKLLDVNAESVRSELLESDHPDIGLLVERADELYQEQILLPLVRRVAPSLPPTPTDELTSPTPLSSQRKAPRPSKRSSTSASRTDGTEMTSQSLGGVSSSSQSSESAA